MRGKIINKNIWKIFSITRFQICVFAGFILLVYIFKKFIPPEVNEKIIIVCFCILGFLIFAGSSVIGILETNTNENEETKKVDRSKLLIRIEIGINICVKLFFLLIQLVLISNASPLFLAGVLVFWVLVDNIISYFRGSAD